jgi:hypothetical protein
MKDKRINFKNNLKKKITNTTNNLKNTINLILLKDQLQKLKKPDLNQKIKNLDQLPNPNLKLNPNQNLLKKKMLSLLKNLPLKNQPLKNLPQKDQPLKKLPKKAKMLKEVLQLKILRLNSLKIDLFS